MKEKKVTAEEIQEIWNAMSLKNHNMFPKVKILTANRKKNVQKLIKDIPNKQDWINLIGMVPNEPFRCGENNRDWTADFDWLIRATKDNHVKLLEEFENLSDAENVLTGGFGS